MKIRRRALPILSTILALTWVGAAAAQGCFEVAGERRTISLSTSGVTVDVSILSNSDPAFVEEGVPTCSASTRVKLSSYPTSRLALRPSDVARAIRDTADELGANECRIYVSYENDTSEEIEARELCKVETFRFDKDSFWSSSSETNCWDTF